MVAQMERTGGEPDVVGFDKNRRIYFYGALRKVLQAAEVIATIKPHSMHERNTKPNTVRQHSLLKWESSY